MTEESPNTAEPLTEDTYMCTLTIQIPLSVLGMLSHEVVATGQNPGVIIANALRAQYTAITGHGPMEARGIPALEFVERDDWNTKKPKRRKR